MHQTPLSAKLLEQCCESYGWTQGDLAKKSGVARTTVSDHLGCQRSIRDEHFRCYIDTLSNEDKPRFLGAYIRDILPTQLVAELVDKAGILKDKVRKWAPSLDAEQRSMLDWWASQLAKDADLSKILEMVSKKAGYKPKEK